VIKPVPGVTETPVGASGAFAGITAVDAIEATDDSGDE
jgi:hypothetical protein